LRGRLCCIITHTKIVHVIWVIGVISVGVRAVRGRGRGVIGIAVWVPRGRGVVGIAVWVPRGRGVVSIGVRAV